MLGNQLSWQELHRGQLEKEEILRFVADIDWQRFRISLKGTTLEHKRAALQTWLMDHNFDHRAKVQVTNYINALRRGGLLKGGE